MKTEIINILMYLILYSFLGWVLESIYKTYMQKKVVNSGFLHGPFCPIYGIGAIIMYIGLGHFKETPILVFTLGIIILSIWEYIVGWGLEKIFNTKYWDYSQNKYNIQGRICLKNSIYWGILGIVFTYIVHPFIQGKLLYIPKGIQLYLIIIIYTYILIDFIISVIKVKNISVKFEKVKEIGENIKEKLEHLEKVKSQIGSKQNNIDSLQKVIDELKLKQKKLRLKLYRHTNRLKKAFPTMKSEIITEILNQKIKNLKMNKKTRE